MYIRAAGVPNIGILDRLGLPTYTVIMTSIVVAFEARFPQISISKRAISNNILKPRALS